MYRLTSVEICAGGGGQALGLEVAGFDHQALVEIDPKACETLRLNRPHWNVVEDDLCDFSGHAYHSVDLLAGGIPCPPFSKAGKQLGQQDERDLFPQVLRLVDEMRPRAVMIENVRGLLDAVFDNYRQSIELQLNRLGYTVEWRLLNASDYGVSQLRPRVVMVALQNALAEHFSWPKPHVTLPLSVGDLLYDLMAANGWNGVNAWRQQASAIAPTLVGGSKKHGGPDLGPTRAKAAWKALGIDGHGLWHEAPHPDFVGLPRLTTRMTARIQGFPDTWQFAGKKTAAYRQIGNAFPPPVAQAVGSALAEALRAPLLFKVR